MKLVHVTSDDEIQLARQLFREYEAGIGISLCFQNFDEEVAALPGKYAPPDGRLLLAYVDEQVGGCIALRKLDGKTCEMKRLFVRPGFRGLRLGRQLVNAIINEARNIGYERMRLDTMPGRMDTAIALYKDLGFKEIAPYYDSPVADSKFMELVL
jgi:GNAT superfamily N-acetyltransferase